MVESVCLAMANSMMPSCILAVGNAELSTWDNLGPHSRGVRHGPSTDSRPVPSVWTDEVYRAPLVEARACRKQVHRRTVTQFVAAASREPRCFSSADHAGRLTLPPAVIS